MKLGIVIPLKSKRVSRNWKTTKDSLHRTLNSIENQVCRNFCVAVVGHEVPEDLVKIFPDVIFESINLPVPNRKDPDFSHRTLLIDKGLKIVKGFQILQKHDVDYWFQLDSDDLLRDDFVETLQLVVGKSGGIIQGGYFMYFKQNKVIPTEEMVLHSGSTFIMAARHVKIPTETDLQEQHMKCSPLGRYPHMTIADYFAKEVKEDYVVFKKPILGYVLASGDNISDVWRDTSLKKIRSILKPYIKGQRFTKTLKKRFGVT